MSRLTQMRSRPGAIGMILLTWPAARFTARLDEDAVGVASLEKNYVAGVYRRGNSFARLVTSLSLLVS